MKKLQGLSYKRTFFISLILISLGVIASIIAKEESGSLGSVMIAIGGLFLIISMAKKRIAKEKQN